MPFDIPTTVTPAEDWSSPANSTEEELDALPLGDTSENVATGAEEDAQATSVEEEDDGTVEAEAEDGTRSRYIKRENFDKVNEERKQLLERIAAFEAAKPAEPAPDEWAQTRAEFEKLGFKTPQQAAQAIEEQKRVAEARLYEAENEQIHNKIASEIDATENPAAYQAMFRAERAALDLHKYSVSQAKETVATRYPDADMEIISAFGSDPRQIEAIAKHTHERIVAVREAASKETAAAIEAAKKQAVLEYIAANQKRATAPKVEGGSAAPARNGNAPVPYTPGQGFRNLIPPTRNGWG